MDHSRIISPMMLQAFGLTIPWFIVATVLVITPVSLMKTHLVERVVLTSFALCVHDVLAWTVAVLSVGSMMSTCVF